MAVEAILRQGSLIKERRMSITGGMTGAETLSSLEDLSK